jgi:hypothetical protein
MDFAQWCAFGFFWFIGLTLGWFCKTGSIFKIILGGCLLYVPLLLISLVDFWWINFAFIFGFMVHTVRPLYRKVANYG